MQSIGHDLRRGLNNFSTGNYKNINKWLAELKNIDSSLKTLDKEITTNAKLISAWGCNEGDDLTDVCQRMTQLMEEVGLIQQAYSIQHTAYRKRIKSLKTQEMLLDDNRKKKHDLTNQIAKQQKSNKENPIKMMDRVSAELLGQELELLQFKRLTIRDAFNCQFDSMIEYSEKMALIAGYGRQITNVIDCGPQPAERTSLYCGAEYTAAAINQVKIAVTSWEAQPVGNPIRAHIAPADEELALSAAATAYNNRTPPMNNHRQSNGQGFVNGAPGSQSPGNWEEVRMLNVGASQASLSESQDADQDHWKKEVLGAEHQDQYQPSPDATIEQSPYITSLQINQLQEQQRHLQIEQQRVYHNNQNMYSSPSPSPSPTNPSSYHHTASSVAASLRQASNDNYGNGGMVGAAGGGSTNGMGGRPFTPTLRRNDTSEFGSSGSISPGTSHNGNGGGYGHASSSYESNVTPSRGGYRLGFTDPRERSRMDNSDVYKSEITSSSRYSRPTAIMDEK
ncbi:hypothetical protein BGZ95_009878 [Linnemannia exigua]|uniref:Eisosome component PIL1-domain-containing protein n=1 Tax=Linnemannia exigua TaxID=604196 RepID=A0AAD4H6E4_9FUNG|nr:hypothetical protein BGZ95_009878 [Linnemannia exigua]